MEDGAHFTLAKIAYFENTKNICDDYSKNLGKAFRALAPEQKPHVQEMTRCVARMLNAAMWHFYMEGAKRAFEMIAEAEEDEDESR